MFNPFQAIRKLYWNIRNIIYWLSIIWRNEQFDSGYLYEMLYHKFKLMEEFFDSKYAWTMDAPRHAHQLRICKNLCKRIMDDDYTSPYDKYIEDHLKEFVKNFLETMNTKSEFEDYIMAGYAHQDYMKQQDIDYLCMMIQKYVQEWWD